MSLKNIGHQAAARWKLSQLMTPLITLVMLGVTFGYWQKEKRESDEARLHFFHEASDQVTNGIQGRLQDFELVLRGFKGLYESSDNLTPSDYGQYFQVLKLDQALASLQAVSLSLHVPQAQKARHLADMRSRGLGRDANDGAIVAAIIHMAHGLGFRTIAEGVEARAQLDYLRAQGCNEIQGYFFGYPVPAGEFANLLRRGEALEGIEPGDHLN